MSGLFDSGVDLNPYVTFHLPGGAVVLGLDLQSMISGQGSSGAVTMPGVGSVPYEVTIGPPPNVPQGDLLSSRVSGVGMLLVGVVAAVVLAKAF